MRFTAAKRALDNYSGKIPGGVFEIRGDMFLI
jgi:hypothetical protein